MTIQVREIHRYPIKSCGGESLHQATVEPWGLAGDRRWMVVDAAGSAVTARMVHELLLVSVRPTATGLTVSAPARSALDVPVPRGAAMVGVDVFGSRMWAVASTEAVNEWFSGVCGRPVRLVHLADPTQRPSNPVGSAPGDRVSLADAYPLLLTTRESSAELDDWIADGAVAEEGPVVMSRFRPNVVVDGAAAWAEDTWRRIRIGDAELRVVNGCDRCVMTTLRPDVARGIVGGGKEPIATLARRRRWAGKTWFGVELVPDTPGATIEVGDEVVVLASGPARAWPHG